MYWRFEKRKKKLTKRHINKINSNEAYKYFPIKKSQIHYEIFF